jgi:hypothetical protein
MRSTEHLGLGQAALRTNRTARTSSYKAAENSCGRVKADRYPDVLNRAPTVRDGSFTRSG